MSMMTFKTPSGQVPLENAILRPTQARGCEACGFRGRKAAAPLKQVTEAWDAGSSEAFPRSKGRGPIEATMRRPAFGVKDTFPRSKGRGPIEAPGILGIVASPYAGFRGRKAAAPLKPVSVVALDVLDGGFRGRKAAAPLKRAGVAFVLTVILIVSAVERPRPH